MKERSICSGMLARTLVMQLANSARRYRHVLNHLTRINLPQGFAKNQEPTMSTRESKVAIEFVLTTLFQLNTGFFSHLILYRVFSLQGVIVIRLLAMTGPILLARIHIFYDKTNKNRYKDVPNIVIANLPVEAKTCS